jgi:hypothetical protein
MHPWVRLVGTAGISMLLLSAAMIALRGETAAINSSTLFMPIVISSSRLFLPLMRSDSTPTPTMTATRTATPTLAPGEPTAAPTRMPSAGCMYAPRLLEPINGGIAYGLAPELTVTLAGQAKALEAVVEVATDSSFSVVKAGGRISRAYDFDRVSPRLSTNLTPATTYYWRAHLVCDNGEGPDSDVWTFTTPASAVLPPAPTLSSPANGATAANPVPLQWSPYPGTPTYSYESCVRLQGTSRPSCILDPPVPYLALPYRGVDLKPGSTYEWWVRYLTQQGWSEPSPTWHFTVSEAPPPTPNPDCPTVPTLLSPANGSTVDTLLPTLTFSGSAVDPSITGAQLELFSYSTSTFYDSWIYQPPEYVSFSITPRGNLTAGATYYWRASYGCGWNKFTGITTFSQPSFAWSFTTASRALAAAPQLLSPANGTSTLSSEVTFQWTPVPGAVSYTLHCFRASESYDWGYPTTANGPQQTLWLYAGHTYRWWVQATDSYGYGYISDTWLVTTPPG